MSHRELATSKERTNTILSKLLQFTLRFVQRNGFIFVVLLNSFQAIGRLSFTILAIPGGIGQFLDNPVSFEISIILHVMFSFLGISGLIATVGLWKRKYWSYRAIFFVNVATIIFDFWGVTIQTSAALGFFVPIISLFYLYLRGSKYFAGVD